MSAPWLQEIFLDPDVESRRVGVRLGDVVVAPFLLATADPHSSGEQRTRHQLREVLVLMDEVLSHARASRKDVIRVCVYLRDLADRPHLNTAWEAFFPDPAIRPPHKYLPANLPDGVDVALGVLALVGSPRQVLEVPGLVHRDPMSLGVRVGNVVASSRLFAGEKELAAQFETLLGHARALFGAAGGSLEDLVQATFFVGSAEIADDVAARAAAQWSPEAPLPVVHVREVDLGSADGFPRLEVLGLIEP